MPHAKARRVGDDLLVKGVEDSWNRPVTTDSGRPAWRCWAPRAHMGHTVEWRTPARWSSRSVSHHMTRGRPFRASSERSRPSPGRTARRQRWRSGASSSNSVDPARVFPGGKTRGRSVWSRSSREGARLSLPTSNHGICRPPVRSSVKPSPEDTFDGVEVPLISIAHGRSGDKGADLNIGIRARSPDYWPVLLSQVTAERAAEWLAHLGASSVDRYELPGIHAVNLLFKDGLGDGGTASLRFDPQGKAVAQQLLELPVTVPAALRPT